MKILSCLLLSTILLALETTEAHADFVLGFDTSDEVVIQTVYYTPKRGNSDALFDSCKKAQDDLEEKCANHPTDTGDYDARNCSIVDQEVPVPGTFSGCTVLGLCKCYVTYRPQGLDPEVVGH